MFKALFSTLTLAAATLILAPAMVGARQTPPTPAPIPTATIPPTPMPSETPLPPIPATPTPIPSATPSSTPSPLPSLPPTPTPLPTATPLPTPLPLPPDAPPQILAIQVSDPVFHSGEHVTGTIITSTNVASVEIHLAGRKLTIPRTDYGVFQMSYTMPHIPFFLRNTYTAQVIALSSTGLQAERDLRISVR